MSFKDFMGKVRYYDNLFARWMLRHFYIIFFEFVLVIIFFVFLLNVFRLIDLSNSIPAENVSEQLMAHLSMNVSIIVILLLLISFWMLYVFNGIERLRAMMKEINFNLFRLKRNQ